MDLNEFIVENKNEYYSLANEYFNNVNIEEYENEKVNAIVSKSISILIDHDFIPTPCVQIRLNLLQDQKEVGSYFLYINKDKEFIDEFLIIE
ncbi:hypothetical protein [Flavobacterium sp. Root186]|uniref:hypothetical protein n=1 Tax=Flavobacterium sp. Root186 TaxID=1736485 RepID=UPI0006FFD6CA|nr:hypothetical protein [Flavobacterium sp. Root186]KRB53861.1 hypothetical protein ASD98_19715 [Flavobacterium sp. Root186]